MDVVLGVAVTGPVARLALVGSGAQGGAVLDQSVVDLEDHPVDKLTETVVGTNRLLADENHRLVGTRVCWTDDPKAAQLRQSLENSGVPNVAVLSESQAVAALMRAAGRPGAALVMDDETATLSLAGPFVGDDSAPPTVLAREPLAGADPTVTFNAMMAGLSGRPDAPGEVYLVGASPELARVADQLRDASTMRVEVAEDPTFALARGAAMAAAPVAAGLAGDATAMAPAVGLAGDATAMAPAAGLTGDETTIAPASEFADPNAQDPQLAYSMTDDSGLLPGDFDEYDPEFDDYDQTEVLPPARLNRRALVIGNAVIAFAVVGLASLATAIAIAVRPTASQQPVVGVQNGTPGKFMPLLPTQQQAPLPPPPVDQPNAGFQGGSVPAPTAVPHQVAPPAGGGAPVPGAPVAPGVVPNPNPAVPVPIPVPIPFPGWHPGYPQPPYNPPYTPPTTTYSPPTTTYSPPTTTYSPPTTTYQPPTTSYQPPTTSYSPPHTQTQETVPPTHSQQPVTPQQPVSPREPHSGGGRHGF